MCFLLFTAPADNPDVGQPKRKSTDKARAKSAITWALLFMWSFLIALAIISSASPKLLESFSHLGKFGTVRAYQDYGDNALRQKKYNLAIAQYQGALRIQPDYVPAMVNLGIAYMEMDNFERADKIFSDALKLESNRKETIYFNLGQLAEKQNKPAEAINYYIKAIGNGFEQESVYQRLGVLYYNNKQFDLALDAFEKLLAIQTDVVTPYQNMLKLSLLNFDEDSSDAQVIKSQLNQDLASGLLSNYDLETIHQIQTRDKNVAKTHNHIGAIYAFKGDIEKATEHFEKSLAIWPGNDDARNNLAILKRIAEQKGLAIAGGK